MLRSLMSFQNVDKNMHGYVWLVNANSIGICKRKYFYRKEDVRG